MKISVLGNSDREWSPTVFMYQFMQIWNMASSIVGEEVPDFYAYRIVRLFLKS